MKRSKLLIVPVLILTLLAGCGGGGTTSAAPMASAAPEMNEAAYSNSPPGMYDRYELETEAGVSEDAGGGAYTRSAARNSKLIKTAVIEMESKSFDEAVEGLTAFVNSTDGYFELSNISNYGKYRSAHFVIRLPAESYERLCNEARTNELFNVTRLNMSADNVGEQYYDVEARLKTQKTKLDRLLSLLERADVMEDIISLENAIADTELQIEYLSGTLRTYDSLIHYSSVTVYLEEVYQLSPADEGITFGARFTSAISNGFSGTVSGLGNFVIFIAANLFTFIILAAIIVGAVFITLRVRKKKGKQE